MGEISDMMINGDICGGCGVTLRGNGEGFPRYCSAECAPLNAPAPKKTKKVRCPQCARMVKATGLAYHKRVMHGSTS